MSVPQLAKATRAHGSIDCPMVGFCDAEELQQLSVEQRGAVDVLPSSRMRWMVDVNLQGSLKRTIRAANGVHIHGIWETHCMMGAGIARGCKRPYIVSAHGMLEPWALRQKRLKKALYAALVETRVLHGAACLRALTPDEVGDYRRLGLANPIAIVPSGVDVPLSASANPFFDIHPQLRGKRIVLFLGRLHPKKGLHLLLQAWERATRPDDVHLVIAGPDSENTLALLQREIDEFKLQGSVTFAGMLETDLKWSALAAASLFVLPSYSEGFSIAVLEALGMEVPVLVTTGCHIPEVATQDCGWVVDPELAPLRNRLEEFFNLSPKEAARMGQRGKELIERRFNWSVVGKQMADVYEWLQGGIKPSEVEIV
jgi:glycosyltransferase involved in cell wall biosynthesis